LKGLHRGRDNGPRPGPGQYGQGQQRAEGRERRSFRGPENRDARPQRASEEHGPYVAPHGEAEHHEEPPQSAAEPEHREPDEGYDEPQPS
jgi:hypothetical protein